jgi:hypothetical protein
MIPLVRLRFPNRKLHSSSLKALVEVVYIVQYWGRGIMVENIPRTWILSVKGGSLGSGVGGLRPTTWNERVSSHRYRYFEWFSGLVRSGPSSFLYACRRRSVKGITAPFSGQARGISIRWYYDMGRIDVLRSGSTTSAHGRRRRAYLIRKKDMWLSMVG